MTVTLPNGDTQSNPRTAYKKGYKNGYEKGRADQKKEDNEFYNFEKTIEVTKKASYEQGAREFAEWCYVNKIDFSKCPENDDCDNCNRTICTNAKEFTNIVLAVWQKGKERSDIAEEDAAEKG